MTAVFVLLGATGLLFFSLVELAFTRLMRLPQRLEAERESGDEALAAYLDDPLTFFVPARILRGLMLIFTMVWLAERADPGLAGGMFLFVSGLLIAIGAGELAPALILRQDPERVLDFLLPWFTAPANVLAPITNLIVGWLGPVARAERPAAADGAPVERAAPAEVAEPQQEADQSRLLRSVVDFGETLVREVMTPRPDIVAIQSDATFDDLRRLVREQEYSRLPVFTENLDNIVGIVVVKDLIYKVDVLTGSVKVTQIMRPAAFVPETKRVADLLREFQQRRFQLALVVDEYGGTAGLVTVEDVVEELVGEIRDEYDSEAEPVVQDTDGSFVFSAKVAIGDMTDRLELEIEEGGFETVGGYVLTRVGRVPSVGERFSFDGLGVEVLEAERRRIHKVRIRKEPLLVEETSE
jgi:CBS domain containing-hemolysin-like protein